MHPRLLCRQTESDALTLSFGDGDSARGSRTPAGSRAAAAFVDDEPVDERLNTVVIALRAALLNEKVPRASSCCCAVWGDTATRLHSLA